MASPKLLLANPSDVTVGSKRDATVTPVLDYKNHKQPKKDEATGLPIWKVSVEIVDADGASDATLKIVAKEAPVIAPMTDYRINGEMGVVAYVPEGTDRVAFSYTLRGTLVPARKEG